MSHIYNKPIHLTAAESIAKHSKISDEMELRTVTGPLDSNDDYENTTSNDEENDEDNEESNVDDGDASDANSSFKNDAATQDTNTNTEYSTDQTKKLNRAKRSYKAKKNHDATLRSEAEADGVGKNDLFTDSNNNDDDADYSDDSATHSSDNESDLDDEDDDENGKYDSDDEVADNAFIDKLLNVGGSAGGSINNEIAAAIQVKSNAFDKESKDVRGRPSACVFVASLSSNISDDVLCQSVTNHFNQWGKIALVKVLRDPANRPYAFVQYANDEDADKAISEGQHSILNGRTVRCEKARVNRTLYLQLKNSVIAEKTMKTLLSRFGEVERLVAVNDDFNTIKTSNVPNRNYFCKYVYRQDAISAFANLKSKPNWNVEWAQNLEDEYNNIPEVTIDRYSIFVGHLDPRISREELLERFEKHGKIKEAILVNRPLSNFAFIKFNTKEAAAAAVDSENHSMFKFKTIHVQYRELYNNFRRKYSNEVGNDDSSLKLNLAPPPVNFRRRSSYHTNKSNRFSKGNQRNNSSYYSKNSAFFDKDADVDNVKSPKTFSQALKMKHPYPQKGRFNFNNTSNNSGKFNKFNRNQQLQTNSFRKPYGSNSDASVTRPESKSANKSAVLDDVEIFTGLDENQTFDTKEIEKVEIVENAKGSKDDSQSLPDHDLDNDTMTVRSSNTYSSSVPKTGYTYSSVDNGEMENANMGLPNQSSQYQYPYYYYYPAKNMPYMNNQRHPMMQDGNVNGHNVPQSANVPYYYAPYSNYPPGTPNSQMPHMYPPVYYYYNQAPVTEHQSEGVDQQFYRNTEGINNNNSHEN